MVKYTGNITKDTIKRGAYTYVRWRLSYNGEVFTFTGCDEKIVREKVNAFFSNPKSKHTMAIKKTSFGEYAYECGTYFSKIKRELVPGPSRMQLDTIRRLNKTSLGKKALTRVKDIDITNYLLELRDMSYSRKTINGDLGYIKRCLNRALEDDLIEKNPCSKVAPIREEEVIKKARQVKSLEVDDVIKLIVESERLNTREFRINGEVGTKVYGVNAKIICFLIYSGLRIGECLALTWGDVDFDKNIPTKIHITSSLKEQKDANGKTILVRGTTKTKCSVRSIVVNKLMKQILMDQKKANPKATSDDYVFVSDEGTPILYRNVNRTLKNMLLRANCKNQEASVHALRHTFGSLVINEGGEVYGVSQILGHSDIRVTQANYLDLLDGVNSRTSSKIDNLIPMVNKLKACHKYSL